ncbi:MAG: TolC family protein [Opitutaceae bacterium]
MFQGIGKRVFAAALAVIAVRLAAQDLKDDGPLLTLNDAIRLALANNHDLRVVSYNRGIAQGGWLTAMGQFDPEIVVNRSESDQRWLPEIGASDLYEVKTQTYAADLQGQTPWGLSYTIGAQATNQGDTYDAFSSDFNTFGGINVTQPLLRGFGLAANLVNVRIAKADRRISEWQYRQAAIDTVTNVVIAYSNLVAAHAGLRIARQVQALAGTLVSDNEKGYRIGSYSKSDVVQAQASAAAREEGILLAERAVVDAEIQLRELIGQDAFPPDQPEYRLELLAPAADLVVRPEADLRTALALRPDYQEARLGLDKNRATVRGARNGLLPEIDFVGGYGYNGLSSRFSAARRMIGDRDQPSYSAGLQLVLPMTNAQARGRARIARLQMAAAEESLRGLEADIALSLAEAGGQIETTRARVKADRTAYNLAKQALHDEVERFHAGRSTTFVVLQLQENLASAENSVYDALADERRAEAEYERELGATLRRHHISLEEN